MLGMVGARVFFYPWSMGLGECVHITDEYGMHFIEFFGLPPAIRRCGGHKVGLDDHMDRSTLMS